MLAFIDSPIQILVLVVVLLIVFGPQKLPELLNQLGRAVREFKRATSDLSSTFNTDLHNQYGSSYNPPSFDSYGNRIEGGSETSTNESDRATRSEITSSQESASPEPLRGDFAASALADTAEDYGVSTASGASSTVTGNTVTGNFAAGEVSKEVQIRPAEGTVSRQA